MTSGKRKSKRGGGPRALAAVVDGVTKPAFGRRGFAAGAVVTDWARIVGPYLAANTAPEKIIEAGERGDEGTLHLRVGNAALATELLHLEPQLVERVNGYFGYRAISRVRLSQGAIPRRDEPRRSVTRKLDDSEETALTGRLAGVDDADLKEALESLGRSVIGRRSTLPKK